MKRLLGLLLVMEMVGCGPEPSGEGSATAPVSQAGQRRLGSS